MTCSQTAVAERALTHLIAMGLPRANLPRRLLQAVSQRLAGEEHQPGLENRPQQHQEDGRDDCELDGRCALGLAPDALQNAKTPHRQPLSWTTVLARAVVKHKASSASSQTIR